MVQIYPGDLAWRQAYPILTFSLFMIFMAFRLRGITAAWLIGLCVVSYLVMLYFKPSGQSVDARVESVIAHATMVPMMYVVGLLVTIPLKRAASAGAFVHAAESMDGFDVILADDSRIPDLIVTDIRPRDGATGKEVADSIRRHFAWAGVIPVAFLTGELLSDRVLRLPRSVVIWAMFFIRPR
ncbi:hypothetical protein [Paraburkholderia sp. MM5477-R1]|uniref:hypothetical protein n=1 Tax=Paraburkholderia sp. MM5477-R1 TaxID=2991062 RepID=UPI003D1D9ACA